MATRQRSTYTREAFYGRQPTASFGVKRHKIRLYIDAFIAERQLRGIAAATITSYHVELGMFGSWLENEGHSQDPATWTALFIKSYLAYLQRRPTRHGGTLSQITLRSYTSRLLAFLKWLHEEGYTTTNIAASIKRPSAPSHVVQGFSRDELLCMVNAARDDRRNGLRDVAIIFLLLDTGIRASELCSIKQHDVLWNQQLVKVLGKGNKERIIPFSTACKDALLTYFASSHHYKDRSDTLLQTEEAWALTPKALLYIIKRVSERGGVSDAHPHRFRHTFAIQFLRRGGNALVLQRLLGHSSLTMTMRYVNLVTDDLSAAHQLHSPLDGLLMPKGST